MSALKFIESSIFVCPSPSISDRANTSPVHQNGGKVPYRSFNDRFFLRRQTPCKSQSTSGKGESVLRKLWLSQDSVVSTLVMFPIFLYDFVLLFIYYFCLD